MRSGQNAEMECHQAIAASLTDNGVSVMFGVMGDGNVFLLDSFSRMQGNRTVAATHEASATLMALAYSSVSQGVGVASVTHGPGLSNTITALIEGVKGHVPMLLLIGDTPPKLHGTWQDIPQRELVIATGAGFVQLRSPQLAAQDTAMALRQAQVERRPVVVNMPAEFALEPVRYSPEIVKLPAKNAFVSESSDIDNAIGLIAAAKRPIVLAGRGAVHARETLIRLADRIGALLAHTLKAKSAFLGHDFDIGIFGTLSSPRATDLILQSDFVIAFGASLNSITTSNGAFTQGKKLVQCNLEWSEIGKHGQPAAGLVGDPEAVAQLILKWLDEADIPASGFRDEIIAKGNGQSYAPQVAKPSADDPVQFEHAIDVLTDAFPAERILVTDGGRFAGYVRANTRVAQPHLYVQNWNFGSIGFGVASAIGASFADPTRPVLLIAGDGGFMLGGLAEFNTAVRYGIDLVAVICNDGSYGSEYAIFQNRNMDSSGSLFDWPDFAPVAETLGGQGFTVRKTGDLDGAIEAIRTRSKPLLIDVKLDPAKMPGRRH